MRKGRAFAEWLYGGFDDPYTYLVWACVIGSIVVLNDTPRWLIVAGVEVVTVAMRVWTRDVIAEKREKRKQKEGA